MDDRIKKAMQDADDFTPDQACQHVLECLESFLQEMDEILPDKTAIEWAAILAKGLQQPKHYRLSRMTNHKVPRYQFYQWGFNDSNSCWLTGEWITVSQAHWEANRASHEAMYAHVRDARQTQNHRDDGISLDKMTPAQKQAWEHNSGSATIQCFSKTGYETPVGIGKAGGKISQSSINWLKKNGYRVIKMARGLDQQVAYGIPDEIMVKP